MELPILFGVRHLSPAGAWHLLQLLEEKRPRLVLIEGPSDLTPLLADLVRPDTVPPVAMLAYTQAAPVRSILYPLAAYSPEYQAIRWAAENGAACRFMDLPSEVFLALERPQEPEGEEPFDPYRELDRLAGADGHDMFWERTLEHTAAPGAYREGAAAFGERLREATAGREADWPENLVREAYMRRVMEDAMAEGYAPGEIVAVTGAYHLEGLKSAVPMSEGEKKALPRTAASFTLMPYSYYRLSSRSGYGAGNKAPAYYGLIWEGFLRGEPDYAPRSYLASIARFLRKGGNPASSASVIEGVRLAWELARLRGSSVPVLRDLRDAALTCLGEGSLSAISQGIADAEIGTAIGALPEGVSRTSIQDDFYRQLKQLKLEKYRDVALQDLALDLRENRSVKSRESAFLDLNRSFFLHRLRVLGVSFGMQQEVDQTSATWAERWMLRWSPEAEIQLVESALKGDTIPQAASFRMKERVETATGVAEVGARGRLHLRNAGGGALRHRRPSGDSGGRRLFGRAGRHRPAPFPRGAVRRAAAFGPRPPHPHPAADLPPVLPHPYQLLRLRRQRSRRGNWGDGAAEHRPAGPRFSGAGALDFRPFGPGPVGPPEHPPFRLCRCHPPGAGGHGVRRTEPGGEPPPFQGHPRGAGGWVVPGAFHAQPLRPHRPPFPLASGRTWGSFGALAGSR